MIIHLSCPTCGRSVQWTALYPFRPFCSERCKLVDLGSWLSDEQSSPEQGVSPSEPSGED